MRGEFMTEVGGRDQDHGHGAKITASREKYLYRIARDLHSQNPVENVLEDLQDTNRKVISPPLPEETVSQIYKDVAGWNLQFTPQIYQMHVPPSSISAIIEGMRRVVSENEGDQTKKENALAIETKMCHRLDDKENGAVVPIEIPLRMDLSTLQCVEGAGVRIVGNPHHEVEPYEAVRFTNAMDLDRIFYHAQSVYQERNATNAPKIITDENLMKMREAFIERARGYLERGDDECSVLNDLINEDRGHYFWEIRISDIIGAAKDALQRANSNARLQNNPLLKLTPASVAERFVDQKGKEIKYVYDLKIWRVWNGIRWEDDPAEVKIQKKIKEVVSNLAKEATLAVEDEKTLGAVTKFFKGLLSNGGIKGLIEIISRDEKIATSYGHFDADPYLLNFENCTYDLRTFTGRPHSPKDLITNVAGQGTDPDTGETITVRYDPSAECPLWKKSLEEWFPLDYDQNPHGKNVDRDTIESLQVRLGYSLSGNAIEDDFLVWYGLKGRNGKGVCKDVTMAVLGSYATVSDRTLVIETYETGKGGSRGDLKNLIGKRLVFVDELKRKDKLDCAFVKDWCGHGIISFRPPYGSNEIHMRPAGSIILLTNNLGSIESADSIWDRLRIVPWTKYFGENERKKNLRSELFKELPGIINWYLEGYKKYTRLKKLPESNAMHASRLKYMEDNNPLADWIADEMILANEVPKSQRHKIKTLKSEVYTYYKNWALTEGYDKKEYLGRTTFYKELEDKYRGVVALKTIQGSRFYQGICLRYRFENDKHTL